MMDVTKLEWAAAITTGVTIGVVSELWSRRPRRPKVVRVRHTDSYSPQPRQVETFEPLAETDHGFYGGWNPDNGEPHKIMTLAEARNARHGLPPTELSYPQNLVMWYGPELRAWNWATELERRDLLGGAGQPYPITEHEFYENEPCHEQEHLFFFPQDGVLCDESFNDLGDIERVTGPLYFGHGHGEANKCCVRNEMLETDYEITEIEDESYYEWIERQIMLDNVGGNDDVPRTS